MPLSKRRDEGLEVVIQQSQSQMQTGFYPAQADPGTLALATQQVSSCTQWSKEEDQTLREKVEQYGTQNWVIIARFLPGRLGRQCRERWHNVIDPSIVRREWTREEDEFILMMHNKIGSKWSQISKMEPLIGRTVSQIKNRFYQNLKDKDISQIKYKTAISAQLHYTDQKKPQKSDTKPKRWANQHLFEDSKKKQRLEEDKENHLCFTTNVKNNQQLMLSEDQDSLNKRILKSNLKEAIKNGTLPADFGTAGTI